MRKAKVLVIEDEPMICWSIENILRPSGYDVAVAHTAVEGIAVFRRWLPDLVLLDLRLPDLDGFHVLREIKEAERGNITAVVLMSAYGESGTAEEAMRLGACEYLQKPVNFEALEHIVENALQSTSTGSASGSPH